MICLIPSVNQHWLTSWQTLVVLHCWRCSYKQNLWMLLHLVCNLENFQKTSLLESRDRWYKHFISKIISFSKLNDESSIKEGSWKIISKLIKSLISSFYFIDEYKFVNVLHKDNINSCTKFRRNLHINLHHRQRISLQEFRKRTILREQFIHH